MIERPPPEIFRRAPVQLHVFIEKIRALVWLNFVLGGGGVIGTSWWRSREKNAAVGGDEVSGHLVGLAVDFSPPPRPPFEEIAQVLGLWVVAKSRVTHIQATPPPVLARTGTLGIARELQLIV